MELKHEVWKLFFDGVANNKGYGAGIVLVTLNGESLPIAVKLAFEVTNNEAEYATLMEGLFAVLNFKIQSR